MHSVSRALNAAVLAFSLVVFSSSCGEKFTEVVLPAAVHSLQVFPNPAIVRVDEVLVMVVTMVADSGADQSLKWTSADPRRVSVSETGILTGISVGPAVVMVQSVSNPGAYAAVPVTVMPAYTGVRSISVAPTTMSLIPGQAQAIAASVDADSKISRDVKFEIDSTSVASVSAAGMVTAIAPGSARVVVRSIADPTVSAVVAVTVRQPSPSQVSIQALTAGGTNVPVNLQSVRGQIDAVINVTAGEAGLARVDLVASNNGRDTVVATQNYGAAVVAARERAMRLARSSADSARALSSTAPIVLSFRTNAFNSTTGVVSLRNGPTSLKAVAVAKPSAGSTTTQQEASNGIAFYLDNPDGFLVSVQGLSKTGTTTANDVSGRRWIQAGRGLLVTTIPVLFSGRQLGGRTISFPGNNPIASVSSEKNGQSTDTLFFPDNYVSAATGSAYLNGELPAIIASDVGGAALNLVPSVTTVVDGGGTGVINAQPWYQYGTKLDGIRIDNAPPPAVTFTIATSTELANTNNWVNGKYKFTAGITNLGPDPGVGLRGTPTNPTPESVVMTILVVGEGLTDTTEVSTGSQLAASSTNASYTAFARYSDRLGNTRTVPLTGAGVHPRATFGVDLAAPTIRYTQTALATKSLITSGSDSVFALATGLNGPLAFAIDAIDDRSGLADGRIGINLMRFSQPNPVGLYSGTTTCVVGVIDPKTGVCNPAYKSYDPVVLPDRYRQYSMALDNGTGIEGYYTFSATVQDQAGNISTPQVKRALLDGGFGGSAPSLTGLGVSGVLAGGQPAMFVALAVDNVELSRGGVAIEYPNLPMAQMLTYQTPAQNGGVVIGTPFDASLTSPIAGTHAAFTFPGFIRGLESVSATDAPTTYPANAKPTALNGWVLDFSPGSTAGTLATNVPIPASAVQTPPGTPGFAAAAGTMGELQFWGRLGASGMIFEAVGPSGQLNRPFARVLLARLDPSGYGANANLWHIVSELTTPVSGDNGIHRTWIYDFGSQSSASYIAIGVSAAGDAIVTKVVPP